MSKPRATPRKDDAQPKAAPKSSPAQDATSVVLQYIGDRGPDVLAQLLDRIQGLESRLHELESAEQRASELQRANDILKAQITDLLETVRRLEIGFRRHVSERVSPDQLKLALATPGANGPDAPSDKTAESDSETDVSAPQTSGQGAGGNAPPRTKPKNRNEHGRRPIRTIPRIIIESIPPHVMLEGLQNFELIGHEDSSTLGHRRGGPVELVDRRNKYVRRTAPSVQEPAQETTEANKRASDTGIPDADGALVVREHEALVVPVDTSFKTNPFVDGAIVRYAPELSCGEEDPAGPVLIAPLPERPIARGLPDPSLLAHLLVGKLDYHTPYYRQEVQAQRNGWPITRANMARWQFESGAIAARIADAMWDDALTRSWIAMDATGTAVRAKGQNRYAHVFVLVAAGDSMLFRFTPKYDGATIEELFGGYKGTIVADASANHNILFGPGKASEAGCWAHARKPFVKALKAGEGELAAFPLQTIQALFKIEEQIALLSPEDRLRVRQAESAPLVDALFAWVDKQRPLAAEHSLVRAGLVYMTNQSNALREFLRNGDIPIHNNASERALRQIVKGRRNWLFHGSDEHAKRSCAITSLIASCVMHGLDPELYLQEILTVAPSWSLSRMLELSPKNWVATRQRLIAEGRLKYLDLARIAGSKLTFRG